MLPPSLPLLGQQWTTTTATTISDKRNHKLEGRETKKMASIFYIHEMPLRIIDGRMSNMNLINDPKQLVNSSNNSSKLKKEVTTTDEVGELCSSEEDEEETNKQIKKKGRRRKRSIEVDKKTKECDLRTAMAVYNIANCTNQSNQTIIAEELGNKSESKSKETVELQSNSTNNEVKQIRTSPLYFHSHCSFPLQTSPDAVLSQARETHILNAKQEEIIYCENIVHSSEKNSNENPFRNATRYKTPVSPQLQRRKYAKHRNSCSQQSGLEYKLCSSFQNHNCNHEYLAATSQRSNNRMILTTLAQLVIIYIIITSSIVIPVTTTNYWPLKKHSQYQQKQQQNQLQLQDQQQQQQLQQQQLQTQPQSPVNSVENNNNQPPRSHQLMIGQHYNNFSSIVPYSIVQDSDYVNGGAGQEDQVMDEQEEQAAFGSDNLPTRIVEGITSTNLKSRALLPLDSNRLILPQMQQIKSRFNQGCVGGTKCQFFAFCWMSGGSLGASCGLLMTCCVTPSRQEIQPGFYGPVVNDPCKF